MPRTVPSVSVSTGIVEIGRGGPGGSGDITVGTGIGAFRVAMQSAVNALRRNGGGSIRLLPDDQDYVMDDGVEIVIDTPIDLEVVCGARIRVAQANDVGVFQITESGSGTRVFGGGEIYVDTWFGFQDIVRFIAAKDTHWNLNIRSDAQNGFVVGSHNDPPQNFLAYYFCPNKRIEGCQLLTQGGQKGIYAIGGAHLRAHKIDFGERDQVLEVVSPAKKNGNAINCIHLVNDGWAEITECTARAIGRTKFLGGPQVEAAILYDYDSTIYVGEAGHPKIQNNRFEDVFSSCYIRLNGARWAEVSGNLLDNSVGEMDTEFDAAIILDRAQAPPVLNPGAVRWFQAVVASGGTNTYVSLGGGLSRIDVGGWTNSPAVGQYIRVPAGLTNAGTYLVTAFTSSSVTVQANFSPVAEAGAIEIAPRIELQDLSESWESIPPNGQYIYRFGDGNNNGQYRVAAATSNTIWISDGDFATSSTSGNLVLDQGYPCEEITIKDNEAHNTVDGGFPQNPAFPSGSILRVIVGQRVTWKGNVVKTFRGRYPVRIEYPSWCVGFTGYGNEYESGRLSDARSPKSTTRGPTAAYFFGLVEDVGDGSPIRHSAEADVFIKDEICRTGDQAAAGTVSDGIFEEGIVTVSGNGSFEAGAKLRGVTGNTGGEIL